jgi:hypothetical protein
MLAAILTLLTQIAGATGEVATITSIIDALITIIPTLVKEYKDLVGPVKNIIQALSTNTVTTADQLTTLQTLDAQVDADFEAAAAAAEAQDT